MYADDTVLYTHTKTKEQAATKLTGALVHVSDWLKTSSLHFNTNKTVCMFFSKKSSNAQPPDVFIEGEKLTTLSDFKYLGIILDSDLTVIKHVKKVANTITFNFANFRHVRPYLTRGSLDLFSHLVLLHKLVTSKYNNSENNRDPLQADLENSRPETYQLSQLP